MKRITMDYREYRNDISNAKYEGRNEFAVEMLKLLTHKHIDKCLEEIIGEYEADECKGHQIKVFLELREMRRDGKL